MGKKEKKQQNNKKVRDNTNCACVSMPIPNQYINKVSMDFVNKMELTLANSHRLHWWKYTDERERA